MQPSGFELKLETNALSTGPKILKCYNSILTRFRFKCVGKGFSFQFLKSLCVMHEVSDYLGEMPQLLIFEFSHHPSLR